jgi:predicted short-subunit dehydrogenase-like oxidoreductase (DUF2520 family)
MLHALCLLDREGGLLLAHYFADAAVGDQDAWEAALAASARPFLRLVGGEPLVVPVAAGAGGRPVVARAARDVVFALSGAPSADELALADALDFLVRLVDGACDGALSPPQVVAFHGKLAVCLSEASFAGQLLHSDVEMVLRNAKLKAPNV